MEGLFVNVLVGQEDRGNYFILRTPVTNRGEDKGIDDAVVVAFPPEILALAGIDGWTVEDEIKKYHFR